MFCENFNSTKLPGAFPERFEADIEYVDIQEKVADTVEVSVLAKSSHCFVQVMFDKPNRIVAFSLDFGKDADIPYFQNSNRTGAKGIGRARVFLDFRSGFQYTLSKDGRVCQHVSPIQSTWQSAELKDGLLSLRDPSEVFLNFTASEVYSAGEVSYKDKQTLPRLWRMGSRSTPSCPARWTTLRRRKWSSSCCTPTRVGPLIPTPHPDFTPLCSTTRWAKTGSG